MSLCFSFKRVPVNGDWFKILFGISYQIYFAGFVWLATRTIGEIIDEDQRQSKYRFLPLSAFLWNDLEICSFNTTCSTKFDMNEWIKPSLFIFFFFRFHFCSIFFLVIGYVSQSKYFFFVLFLFGDLLILTFTVLFLIFSLLFSLCFRLFTLFVFFLSFSSKNYLFSSF